MHVVSLLCLFSCCTLWTTEKASARTEISDGLRLRESKPQRYENNTYKKQETHFLFVPQLSSYGSHVSHTSNNDLGQAFVFSVQIFIYTVKDTGKVQKQDSTGTLS